MKHTESSAGGPSGTGGKVLEGGQSPLGPPSLCVGDKSRLQRLPFIPPRHGEGQGSPGVGRGPSHHAGWLMLPGGAPQSPGASPSRRKLQACFPHHSCDDVTVKKNCLQVKTCRDKVLCQSPTAASEAQPPPCSASGVRAQGALPCSVTRPWAPSE